MKFEHIMIIIIFLILLSTIILGLPSDPSEINLSNSLQAPNYEQLFGTDHLGRDILSRIAHGFFWDISLSLIIVSLSLVTGVMLGLYAGYFGNWLDELLIIIMDMVLSLPNIVLAIVIMIYLSYSTESLIIALTLTGWIKYARIVRAQTYSIREADFIIYEKLLGAKSFYILTKHILPNVIHPILSLSILHLGHSLLSIAALGFLGLGLQPPSPEWGTMIMESRQYIMVAPWTAIFPGIFIFLLIALFTVLGYRLEKNIIKKPESIQC